MATYLEKALHLHPGIQNIVYWHEKGPQAPFDDPYDRLLWNHPTIPKPSKAELDAVLDSDITAAKLAALKASLKSTLQNDPLLKTILQVLVELKAAKDGTSLLVARNAILDIYDGNIT